MTLPSSSGSDGLTQFMSCTMRDPGELLSLTFYKSRPKNVVAGVLRGAWNVVMGTGIGVGAGCAVAARAVQHRSPTTGLLSLFTLASSTAIGASLGLQQMVTGALGTLDTVRNMFFGNAVWDETLAAWVTVKLVNDLENIPQTNADLEEKAHAAYNAHRANEEEEGESGGEESQTTNLLEHPEERDDSLYRLLGVNPDATTSEIKKAYRQKALTQHPDKCGNTEQSIMNFQKLSEAYTILSNPTTRGEYDHRRKCHDSSEAFSSLSTSSANPLMELVRLPFAEPLIGPLAITLLITPYHFYTNELRREAQHRRELRVAGNLSGYLDNLNGLQSLQIVIQDTFAGPCGPRILRWVAEEYKSASRQFRLHPVTREVDEFFSNSLHTIQLWWSYWGVFSMLRSLPSMEDPEAEHFRSILGAVSETNIRQTVRQAAKMVLYDQSVTLVQRSERAKKLGMIAEKIYEVLSSSSDAT